MRYRYIPGVGLGCLIPSVLQAATLIHAGSLIDGRSNPANKEY